MYDLNKVHHTDWLNNNLPEESVQLIIADPPYFEIRGAFDFIWKSFEEYLADVERWAAECWRVLAPNGSLFWYGHARNIAYAQVIFDRQGFNLINNAVWDKGSFMNLEDWSGIRSLAPCTERVLFYDKGELPNGRDYIHAGFQFFQPVKKQLDDWLDASGFTLQDATRLTNMASHYFGFSKREKTQFCFPTLNLFQKLQAAHIFPASANWDILRAEYERLLESYEPERIAADQRRRYFSNEFKLQEILRYSNEQHKQKQAGHETPKPETLSRALILSTTKPGDLVLVPFAGSGTEVAMAAREGRNFIGFDVLEKHVNNSNNRAGRILRSPQLF